MRSTAAVAVSLLCSVTAATAMAGQSQFPTFFDKFKFEASTTAEEEFAGKIDSAKDKCVKDRKVVLYRKKDGEKSKIGTDETNGKGKFSIGVGNGPPKNGKYFAEAKQLTYKNNSGDKVTCLDAKSGSVTIS